MAQSVTNKNDDSAETVVLSLSEVITLLLRMPLYLWPATQKEAPDASCHLLYGTYGNAEGTMDLTVLDAETNTKSTRTVVVTA